MTTSGQSLAKWWKYAKKNLVSEKDTGTPGPKGPKDPIIKYLGLG